MNSPEAKCISQSLFEISQITVAISSLTNYLVSKGGMNLSEKQVILAGVTDIDKATELYTSVMKRCPKGYYTLLNGLMATGNHDVVGILNSVLPPAQPAETSISSSTRSNTSDVSGDAKLLDHHIPPIWNVVKTDTLVLENWSTAVAVLLPPEHQVEIKKKDYKSAPIQEIVVDTLKRWQSTGASPTLNTLIAKFKEFGWTRTAEGLEESKGKILSQTGP